jgi:hypothetical protein
VWRWNYDVNGIWSGRWVYDGEVLPVVLCSWEIGICVGKEKEQKTLYVKKDSQLEDKIRQFRLVDGIYYREDG